MNITLKYQFGQTVWFTDYMSRSVSGVIKAALIQPDNDGKLCVYYILYSKGIPSPHVKEEDVRLSR